MIAEHERAQDIIDAIARFSDSGETAKPEWFLELRELVTSLSKGERKSD